VRGQWGAGTAGTDDGCSMISLSIVMPVYNESATIVAAIRRVRAVDYPCRVELIVVDDGSTDTTFDLLETVADDGVVTVRHPFNRGKGEAVRTGILRASGTHVLVLDADLEYSPFDIPGLLRPVLDGVTDRVFGTRMFGFHTRFPSYRFAVGGRLTTLAANLLFDSCITDMHACLKLIPTSDYRALTLTERGFGFDTELTANLLRAGVRPYEVPITYYGRTWSEGKKITWRDGVKCLRILFRTKFGRRTVVLGARSTNLVVLPGGRRPRSQRMSADQEPALSADGGQ
jgi:glycosyltransferase involved in cell wall biosynthesis